VLLPGYRNDGRINDPEYEAIALALMKGIFHDDEDELNGVLETLVTRPSARSFSQGC